MGVILQGPDGHYFVKNIPSTQHSSIAHDEAMYTVELLHLEEKARVPQLIPRFGETIQRSQKFIARFFRQAVQLNEDGRYIVVERIDQGICELAQAGQVNGPIDLPGRLIVPVL
jgi:hypothetical protein